MTYVAEAVAEALNDEEFWESIRDHIKDGIDTADQGVAVTVMGKTVGLKKGTIKNFLLVMGGSATAGGTAGAGAEKVGTFLKALLALVS